MEIPTHAPEVNGVAFDGEKRLAFAIIEQAIRDASVNDLQTTPVRVGAEMMKRPKAEMLKGQARYFLTHKSPDLDFWCGLAGIETTYLTRKMKERFGSIA